MKKWFVILFLALIVTAGYAQQRAYSLNDVIVKEGMWYDVRAYGAIVNDDISDSLAIQAAIDSCESQGGGHCVFCIRYLHIT